MDHITTPKNNDTQENCAVYFSRSFFPFFSTFSEVYNKAITSCFCYHNTITKKAAYVYTIFMFENKNKMPFL